MKFHILNFSNNFEHLCTMPSTMSSGFRILTKLCCRHHYLISKYFNHLRRNLIPICKYFHGWLPLAATNLSIPVSFCILDISFNRHIQYDLVTGIFHLMLSGLIPLLPVLPGQDQYFILFHCPIFYYRNRLQFVYPLISQWAFVLFLLKKKIKFWLYWFFAAVHRLSLIEESRDYSCCGVWDSHCGGFSCWGEQGLFSLWCVGSSLQWLLLLWSTGSRCMAQMPHGM